jgi:molecular chaperone IbpB/HSP20 family protein
MKGHDFPDLGKVMDDIFCAAEDFTNAFTDRMRFHPNDKGLRWNREFYSTYSFPPSNVFMTEDKTLVFEFAVAGFPEDSMTLEFKGDYLVFSGELPEDAQDPEDARYFKRRLKRKSFSNQRYYVPSDKFDRETVKAVYRNGMLTVTIPARDEVTSEPGVSINIEIDDEKPKAKAKPKKDDESKKEAD